MMKEGRKRYKTATCFNTVTCCQAQKIRDQRRRKMAYYNSTNGNEDKGGASSDTTATPKTVSPILFSLS